MLFRSDQRLGKIRLLELFADGAGDHIGTPGDFIDIRKADAAQSGNDKFRILEPSELPVQGRGGEWP